MNKIRWSLQSLTLNGELSNIGDWLTTNLIYLIADKTKYVIFSYKKTIIKKNSATVEGNNIQFLGIIFDKHLAFKNHVDMKVKKKNRNLQAYHFDYFNISY